MSTVLKDHLKATVNVERGLKERHKKVNLLGTLARSSFYVFVRLMGPFVVPGFKDGAHIRVVCDALQWAYETDNARLMIFLAPGSSKSILGSLLFPAWVYGREPSWQVLHVAHTFDFISKFGGKIRDLLGTPEYQAIFPNTKLNDKYGAMDYWETTEKGVYRCAGAGSSIAGKRGNIGICDDLVSEQTVNSKLELEKIKEWWAMGFESRLLEGGKIVLINTRWSLDDPAQWLMDRSKESPELDQWRIITIPAILDKEASLLLGHPEGTSYWPEVWKTETLLKKKAANKRSYWLALYQQQPIALDGNILKVEHVKMWKRDETPGFVKIIASLDTAFSTKDTADYSVMQIWGIFTRLERDSQGRESKVTHLFLVDQVRERLEYPDLVRKCEKIKKKYDPEVWVIEKKASGQSLIQDLRRRGYLIAEYTPDKDKVSRATAITPFLEAGRVWFLDKMWARDTLDEWAAFPKGRHDDTVDAAAHAFIYLRDSHLLTYEEEDLMDDDDVPEIEEKLYW